jgi:hypothetical protein
MDGAQQVSSSRVSATPVGDLREVWKRVDVKRISMFGV